MAMTFKVPKFEDGNILSEQELYALARLSIEFFRWNCIAGKNFGFFAPWEIDFISSSNSWNQFDWENDTLSVSNLFVISLQGYPFIIQGQKRVEKIGKTLFAVAHLAKDSQSYNDNGYKIDFKWDLPEIELNPETEPFLIELGRVTGNDSNRKFSMTPPVLQLTGTSKLWRTVSDLKKNIDKYVEQLIISTGENNLDCSEYIDRLERLNLFSNNTEVNKFIDIALLTLKSAAGFYHRLIYHQNYSKLEDQSCKNLQGRALEKQLAKINGNKIEKEIFDSIDELLEMEVKTGHEQQTFIEKLNYLFSSNSRLFQRLQTNIQEIFPSKGYPQTFDIMRVLYRYELQQNKKKGKSIVVEFNVEPSNVAFIFASEENIKSTETLIPLKQKSEKENINKNRYKLVLDVEDYLFIASPPKIIKKVELIQTEKN
ncbi:hypothetical protein G7B40_040525 [Aetokthonos hydrillicola Thurmond2011]|jgi:hypothetical protein|uniref:Uncharacterized protein n=1 Tax=Aetokthonos hydrillicola Thurmond2011 TaxID=2712845 RepID=A0AAP5IFS7_9CYAN|nr:hypothetical protein [Aetokthonos hydrillicola]MBO3461025.1 hypothetical protein [Aetokthonos hydrillicola CCALA 1050]MBW4588406.1 hypothetical protein [Aetokthonos hydrillicola CCALA 1050]MDR9900775.1 hypothetical protein [Aetokthonos hydrillicola Thurmond2011]